MSPGSSHHSPSSTLTDVSHRIIEPITSRCSKFRFKPLDSSNALARLTAICDAESIPYDSGALPTLIEIADGDLRKAITFLQSASKLLNAGAAPGAEGGKITTASVQDIGGVVPTPLLRQLTRSMGVPPLPSDEEEQDDEEMTKTTFEGVQRAVLKLVREGFSATQTLSQLHDALILHPLLDSRAKASIGLTLGAADKYLTDGAEEELQLFDVCLKIRAAVIAKQ